MLLLLLLEEEGTVIFDGMLLFIVLEEPKRSVSADVSLDLELLVIVVALLLNEVGALANCVVFFWGNTDVVFATDFTELARAPVGSA